MGYLKNRVFYKKYLHTVQEMKSVICSENGYMSLWRMWPVFVLFLLCGHGKSISLRDITVNIVWF